MSKAREQERRSRRRAACNAPQLVQVLLQPRLEGGAQALLRLGGAPRRGAHLRRHPRLQRPELRLRRRGARLLLLRLAARQDVVARRDAQRLLRPPQLVRPLLQLKVQVRAVRLLLLLLPLSRR